MNFHSDKLKQRGAMKFLRTLFFLVGLFWPGFLKAQEIKSIDISNVHPRTELRHPPAPQSDCEEGTGCIGGVELGTSRLMISNQTPSSLSVLRVLRMGWSLPELSL